MLVPPGLSDVYLSSLTGFHVQKYRIRGLRGGLPDVNPHGEWQKLMPSLLQQRLVM